MKYILNAFSLNMLGAFPATVKVAEATLEQAAEYAADATSAVGHADTAAVFSSVLGCAVPANRVSVAFEKGATHLVGQYRGPRLEEGTTTLPEGATIQWLFVTLE